MQSPAWDLLLLLLLLHHHHFLGLAAAVDHSPQNQISSHPQLLLLFLLPLPPPLQSFSVRLLHKK
jgi:hypothetical protein